VHERIGIEASEHDAVAPAFARLRDHRAELGRRSVLDASLTRVSGVEVDDDAALRRRAGVPGQVGSEVREANAAVVVLARVVVPALTVGRGESHVECARLIDERDAHLEAAAVLERRHRHVEVVVEVAVAIVLDAARAVRAVPAVEAVAQPNVAAAETPAVDHLGAGAGLELRGDHRDAATEIDPLVEPASHAAARVGAARD
jgi:hypothetical protein